MSESVEASTLDAETTTGLSIATRQASTDTVDMLENLARKVLWLASWTIHNANHLRDNPDGLKVGGHQASCSSLVTVMCALYFAVLRPHDRVAVKPHASPVFHAIQYLLGNQSQEKLEAFRAMGGAQSYPSRTKDTDDVDFSTGSVGLGVAMTTFASLAQDYLDAKNALPPGVRRARMVALLGDAELDEGNIYEALLEGWKHKVRDVWWVVDYNRQSLDTVVTDRLFGRINELFESMGWRVETLKYGRRLQSAFKTLGGDALRQWIDDCPNSLYSVLAFKGGAAWREHLLKDIGDIAGIKALLDRHDDNSLHVLMTDLGGHCMDTVLEAFQNVHDDQPTCFIAYTIKGHGLPFAGHKDNHAGLMSVEQMQALRERHRVPEGSEWAPFAGLDIPEPQIRQFLAEVPFASARNRRHQTSRVKLAQPIQVPSAKTMSTQESFGRILASLARDSGTLADRIVTTSPDVTVSTNLGGWVNRRGIFDRTAVIDRFTDEDVVSFQKWDISPKGQHIELGIAENNLFILLAALGLSHSLFGQRLIPIGTLYDPFIQRGLDALNYACYQDARFIVVATPSGISLAPEGGAHQSISTPLIGIGQAGLDSFEPAYSDELAAIMTFAFAHLQRDAAAAPPHDLLSDAKGGSVYLRLSTRSIVQPERELDESLTAQIIDGGYWVVPPSAQTSIAVVYQGVVAPQALEAHAAIIDDIPDAALLAVTSADRLAKGWHGAERARRMGLRNANAHVETLLGALPQGAGIISVIDAHPQTLSWLGSVRGHRLRALGVEDFGQSGAIDDLYRYHQIDTQSIIDACAAACLDP
jgi:pyruvate dehydrogenase E1 component